MKIWKTGFLKKHLDKPAAKTEAIQRTTTKEINQKLAQGVPLVYRSSPNLMGEAELNGMSSLCESFKRE